METDVNERKIFNGGVIMSVMLFERMLTGEDEVTKTTREIREMVQYLKDNVAVLDYAMCYIRTFTANKNGDVEFVAGYNVNEFLSLYDENEDDGLYGVGWYEFGLEKLLDQAKEHLNMADYKEFIREAFTSIMKERRIVGV